MKRRFPSAHPLRALLACLLLLALVVPILGGCEQLFDFANEAEKRPEETGR